MARRGRKRKLDAKRYPNGQVVHGNIFEVVQNQPHRRAYGKEFKDQKLENELGRMTVDGDIEPMLYDAGLRYREIVIGMRRVLGCPSPDARSSAGIMLETSGRVIDLDSVDPDGAAERSNRARAEYADAFRALNDTRDKKGRPWRDAVLAVNAVAIWDRDRSEAPGGLDALKAGLTVLALHFGLSGRRRTRA